MLKKITPTVRIDVKLYLLIFLACTIPPIYRFALYGEASEGGLILMLVIIAVANFIISSRGDKGGGIIMTVAMVLIGFFGQFIGMGGAVFLQIMEVEKPEGWTRTGLELGLSLCVVILISSMLYCKESYEALRSSGTEVDKAPI